MTDFAMNHAQIGSLKVSRVGFGCYGMGGSYGGPEPRAWESQVRLALDLGINLFDTADLYGDAESWLGRWLRPVRSRVAIATKFGVTADGGRAAGAEQVRSACEASLKRLGTDWIDLYQVHFDDPSTPVAETACALADLRREGKIREYGIGHLPAGRVAEYFALRPEAIRPASLLLELSLVAPAGQRELLPHALAAGAAGVAFSPTGRGLLTGAIRAETAFQEGDIRSIDPLFRVGRRRAALALKDRLAAMGGELGLTPAQLAISWVLAQPGIAAVLTGPSSPSHLRENVAAATVKLPAAMLDCLKHLGAETEQAANREAVAEMREVLRAGPGADGRRATGDLLFVMETALGAGLTEEKEIMPLATRLLKLRGDSGPAVGEAREEILLELRKMLEDKP